jgi:rRNA maturation RNase YbeY
MINVAVAREQKNNLTRRLNAIAAKTLRNLKVKNSQAGIFLLSSKKIASLKARFFKKKSVRLVDVLSFPEPPNFPHPERRKRFLGEVYLNKNLIKLGEKRVGFFLIHGLLHLLGYSHGKKRDTVRMERLERKLLRKVFGN